MWLYYGYHRTRQAGGSDSEHITSNVSVDFGMKKEDVIVVAIFRRINLGI